MIDNILNQIFTIPIAYTKLLALGFIIAGLLDICMESKFRGGILLAIGLLILSIL